MSPSALMPRMSIPGLHRTSSRGAAARGLHRRGSAALSITAGARVRSGAGDGLPGVPNPAQPVVLGDADAECVPNLFSRRRANMSARGIDERNGERTTRQATRRTRRRTSEADERSRRSGRRQSPQPQSRCQYGEYRRSPFVAITRVLCSSTLRGESGTCVSSLRSSDHRLGRSRPRRGGRARPGGQTREETERNWPRQSTVNPSAGDLDPCHQDIRRHGG
jgi:hypothetical protein